MVAVRVRDIVSDIRVKVQDKRIGNLTPTSPDEDICRFMLSAYNRLWRKNTQAVEMVSLDKRDSFVSAVSAAAAQTRLDIYAVGSDMVNNNPTKLADREVPMIADFRYLLSSSAALETESVPKQGVEPVSQIPVAVEEERPIDG